MSYVNHRVLRRVVVIPDGAVKRHILLFLFVFWSKNRPYLRSLRAHVTSTRHYNTSIVRQIEKRGGKKKKKKPHDIFETDVCTFVRKMCFLIWKI